MGKQGTWRTTEERVEILTERIYAFYQYRSDYARGCALARQRLARPIVLGYEALRGASEQGLNCTARTVTPKQMADFERATKEERIEPGEGRLARFCQMAGG
jgi:hypothetical protein